MIDARGIGAVFLQPSEYVRIQAHSDQLLWGTPELGQLLIGERGNIGVVDPRSVRPLRGLFQIDSALARICFAGRDDADNFFAIWVLLTIRMHHERDARKNL